MFYAHKYITFFLRVNVDMLYVYYILAFLTISRNQITFKRKLENSKYKFLKVCSSNILRKTVYLQKYLYVFMCLNIFFMLNYKLKINLWPVR